MGCSISVLRKSKTFSESSNGGALVLFKPSQDLSSVPHSIRKAPRHLTTPEMPICYLFGINERKEDCILSFDSSTEQFQSKDIPQGLEIWNYSSALYLSPEKIILTGGINKTYSEITKKSFLYNPTAGTVTPLPVLNQARYTHMSSYFEDRVFVLGGRTYGADDVALLSHVEAFDQKTGVWVVLAPMRKPRCTGFLCIYRGGLYVFGGYTGPLKRSKVVERYDNKKNVWELMNFKLHRGIECGLLISIREDELVLIGGQIRAGPTKTVLAYDFMNKTVHFRSKMSNARVLQKGFLHKDILYIFGGDNSSLVEKASVNNWEWSDVPAAVFTQFVALDHIEKFAHTIPPLYVNHIVAKPKSKLEKPISNEEKINEELFYMFGTDEEPFIMEFNITKGSIRNLPVPLGLQLYCYQSGAKVGEREYFLCGGIHYQMDQILRKCFLYNGDTQSANAMPPMFQERYTFNCLFKAPYVYAIAGRSYGEDNDAILKKCERFSINDKKWTEIAPINQLRCSSMSFILRNKIYICGGYKGNGEREGSIEVYNDISNIWDVLSLCLDEGIEASSVEMLSDSRVLVLGGREVSGDTNRAFIFEQSKEDSELKVIDFGNIGNPRCLHKSYRIKNQKMADWILIFGGNDVKSIETFSLKKKRVEEPENWLKNAVDEFRFELELFVGDIKLKRYLML